MQRRAGSGPRASTTAIPAAIPPYVGEAVLEGAPNAIVAVDGDGRIRYANPAVEGTFGYRPEDVVGTPVEVLLPASLAERHEQLRASFMERPRARPMGTRMELVGRRAGGEEFPVEISLSPVTSGNGVDVLATIVDIGARKAAEAALAEGERRFRTVLEASPNAIVAVDEGGRIRYTNPQVERTFGYTQAELLGQPVELLLPERFAGRHANHRAGFVADPQARPMGIGLDLAGRRRDGREFPVEISLSPVVIGAGIQVFATIVDITARKAVEAELLQARKLESIGRLAGGIAHDFNNILFAISGSAELLEQDLLSDGLARIDRIAALRNVRAISEAARRGAGLTAQLLAFGRQQVVSDAVVEVNAAVRELEPMLQRLIGETVRLSLRPNPSAGRIRIDQGQLDQILVNLVVNARDAMPRGGTITVETNNAIFDEAYASAHADVRPGRYVSVTVSDTGEGMDKETQEHIFEPFYTTKERGKGTGLGLATTYGIVRRVGGHIWLYSEPGLGSTFRVYFPRVDEVPAEEAAERREPARVSIGTVLVVEDEAAVRDIATRLLERAGLHVVAVSDGLEALVALEREEVPIEVVVSDVVMPNMSGIELAEQIIERRPRIGLVLLSGYTAETLGLERLIARGVRFVTKPVTADELLRAIYDVTEGQRSEPPPG